MWDSFDFLSSLNSLLIFIGIVVGTSWAILTYYLERNRKNIRSIKDRLYNSTKIFQRYRLRVLYFFVKSFNKLVLIEIIIGTIFFISLYFLQTRINELNDIERNNFNNEIRTLKAKDSTSNWAVDSLSRSSAHIENELNDAKKELNNIKEPRSISEQQRKKFIEYFSDKPKVDIILSHIISDDEAKFFATQLFDLFIAVGFRCSYGPTILKTENTSGIIIFTPTEDFRPAFLMQQAFDKAGIYNIGEINSRAPFNSLRIIVGHKIINHKIKTN